MSIGMTARNIKFRKSRFQYPKVMFLKRAVNYIALVFFAMFLLAFFNAPLPWLIGFFAIFFIFILVFGISPFITSHVLTDRNLIINQGWYFRVTIPLTNIQDSKPMERGRSGLKGSMYENRLYVTTSDTNMVSIKLKEPIRIIYVLGKKVVELVINVDNMDIFTRELTERIHSLQSIPTVLSPSFGI